MKKTFALKALILLLAFGFVLACYIGCACENEDTPDDSVQISGSEATWQKLTVFVPEGMVLVGGSALDASDPNTAWIQRSGDELSYFLINIVSESTAESTVKTTKELNSGEDVSFKVGGIQWQGVKYKYAGVSDNFQVYGSVNGKTVMVSGSRFACDSKEAKAVLGSIKLAD